MINLKQLSILTILSLLTASGFCQITPSDTTKLRQDSLLDQVKENLLDNIPVISLDDNDLSDGNAQNVSSVLTAGRDPFNSAASYNFSPVRFRIRGYDNDLFGSYINGIPVDNLDNGFTPYGLWGGLNDVFRNRDVSLGLRYNTFAFGDIGGATSIDTRASRQRKQTSLSYALSNRNYTHRVMLTHSTGMNKKGWAFTFSGSRRYADEGYVPGTYYDGWSYFAAIDKKIGQKHLLSLTVFGAPTESGRQGGSVQEARDLAGTNFYNPYWGYQNGKKRNASVGKTNQPYFILTHDFKIGANTSLVTAAGYSFGDRSTTALDWYNATDPRPDYYRYLPSYYAADPARMEQVKNQILANPNLLQIDWARLYDANRSNTETVKNVNGIQGNDITGKRSRYIVEERVINTKRFNANSVLNTRLSDHATLTAGASYQMQKNNYYKEVNDLLGGEFYVDLNQFAERDFPNNPNANQNDLQNPNRILHVGDKFGYDYDITINRAAAWAQTVFKFNKVDFFVAAELSNTKFWRTGHNQNGLFPNNSFGKSTVQNFTNYAFKGGVTYKIDGRNYLYVNGSYLTKAPMFENAYISPRTRDFTQTNLTDEKIKSIEGGYILNSPKVKFRISGYYTTFDDQLNVISFYHDEYRNFVNYALSNIDKEHYGAEIGLEAKIMPNVTMNAAAAIGRYYYDSRQNAVVTLDNNASTLQNETIYSQNFHVPGTPQEAYSLGFTYRSPNYWFVSLTGNYFDQMWLDFNPLRRTYQALQDIDPTSPKWHEVIDQTQLKAQYTIDFFGGYSWKLPKSFGFKKSTFLVINAGVNNLTNNKDIITGGYEQLRYDYVTNDVNKFPPKLFYAYGLNYFVGLTLRF